MVGLTQLEKPAMITYSSPFVENFLKSLILLTPLYMAATRKEAQYIDTCFSRLFGSFEPPGEDMRLFSDFSLNSAKLEAQSRFLERNS
jgi:hypothetical protein